MNKIATFNDWAVKRTKRVVLKNKKFIIGKLASSDKVQSNKLSVT